MIAGELARLRKLFQSILVHLLLAIGGAEPDVSQPIAGILFNRAACLGNCFVILARVVINLGADGIEERRDGIQGGGSRVLLMPLLEPIAPVAVIAKPTVSGRDSLS